MCLNPLLVSIHQQLQGLRINKQEKTTAVAYADDVTVFITTPAEIPKLQEIIHCYEETTGARVNIHKSRAVAIGKWNRAHTIMNIPYKDKISILGRR
jgi:hypothetical protein